MLYLPGIRNSTDGTEIPPPKNATLPLTLAPNHAEQGAWWTTMTRSRGEMERLAQSLGTPIPPGPGYPIVHSLTPKYRSEAKPRSLSGLHGLDAFPFHSDCAHWKKPARYVLLRCARASSGCSGTQLLDSRALPLTPTDWTALEHAVWVVRGGSTAFLAPIVERTYPDAHDFRVRFDRGCMKPAHPTFASAGVILERAAHTAVGITVTWEPGLTVVIDNWRCLHGRDAASDLDLQDRELERVLVSGEGP